MFLRPRRDGMSPAVSRHTERSQDWLASNRKSNQTPACRCERGKRGGVTEGALSLAYAMSSGRGAGTVG
jgi:hypothetical protein